MNDLISRQAAIDAMKKRIDELFEHLGYDIANDLANGVGEGIEVIKSLPSTDRTGHWVEDEYGISHCSECGAINNTVYRNFCAECGADMRGGGK